MRRKALGRGWHEGPAGRQYWPSTRLAAAGTACLLLGSGLGSVGLAEGPLAAGNRQLVVEVLDETGRVITDQLTGALEVSVGGNSVESSDLGPVGDEWRVVLYFDQLLASVTDFHNATIQLSERARELTRLGPVEVVLAGREVVTALPATRDAEALSQALGWLRLREVAANLQSELRSSFLEELGLGSEDLDGSESRPVAAMDPVVVAERARIAIADEVELLQRFREELLLWFVDHSSPGPKALFVIGSGFDPEPSRFYREILADSPWPDAVEDLPGGEVQPSVEEFGRALAAYGWTALCYVPARSGDALLEETEEQIAAREEEEMTDVVFQDGRMVDRTVVGIDPSEIFRRRRQREAERVARPVLRDAQEPFRQWAEASGGELVLGKYQLSDLLTRLTQRHRVQLTATGSAVVDLLPLRVSVRSAPDDTLPEPKTVRAREWISDTTPEAVSRVRARHILLGEMDEGELVISAALQPSEQEVPARLIVKRDALVAGDDPTGPVRVTVAEGREDGSTAIFHDQQTGWRLPRTDVAGQGDLTLELSLPAASEGALVVLVEELETGLWGGTFASLLEAAGSPSARDVHDALLLPAPKVIHLLAPAQAFAVGATDFETVISRGDVARVDFYLDGEREAVRRSAPFVANLDLGPLPHPRRVEVVALDEQDREIGRDYLIVNEGSGVFGVRIVEPRPDLEKGRPPRLVGPVDVEAEVEPRRGEGIDRVEFYWKENLVATRYARPYRQRIVIPSHDAVGFIRVVAYLEDGASSEDVVFVNSPGPSERLQVNLMELYVVVTDRRGRPVTGLSRDLFRIREEGELQEIATFSDAGELPLTVGMVIDSSASMFVKLPEVQFAAAEFLRGLATRKDRAFVVGFGSQPRITRSTTSDLPAVIRSLDGLKPDGQTGIWKAIVYSLVQLQGVPGKKALIVYTDGADQDPDFSFRTCLRFARKVGVPVYVILSNNEIVRTEGKGLNVRGFLERLETLTDSVGGKVFLARVGQDLAEVYREIDEELRSQYVVGYYSRDTGGREWRRVEIEVANAGYRARTIAGYYR